MSKVDAQSVQIVGLAVTARAPCLFAEMNWARPTLKDQNVGARARGPRDVVAVGDVIVVEKVEKPAGAERQPYPPRTYRLAPGAQRRGRRCR